MRKNLLPKNLLMLLLLLLLTLTSTTAALAQAADLPAPFCGELADDDCDLLADSQAAMLDVQEMTTSTQIDLLVAGIPDLPLEEVSLSVAQDSVIAMDPTVIQELTQLQASLQSADASDMDTIMEDYMALVVDLYSTLGLDSEVTIILPEDIAALLSEQAGGIAVPEEITLQIRLTEGFIYVNLDDLAAAIPELEAMEGWFGLDIATFMSDMLEQASAEASASDMASLQMGMGAGSMLNSEAVRGLLEDFVNVERLDDDTIDLQDVAVFSTTFDFGGFIASEGFQTLIRENLDLINQMADTSVTEDELDEVMLGLRFLGPSLFQDLEFEILQSIGLEDNYIYQTETHFAWDLKTLMALAAMADGGRREMPDVAPVINFDLMQESGDFNDAPEIEAPEDAQIIPLEALEEGMN